MDLKDRLLHLFSAMEAVDERIGAKDMAERRLQKSGTLFGTSDRKKIQGTLRKQAALIEKNQRTLQQALSLIIGDCGLSKDTFVQACRDEADRLNADWGRGQAEVHANDSRLTLRYGRCSVVYDWPAEKETI